MATDRRSAEARARDQWMDWWIKLVFVATVLVILGAMAATAYLTAEGAGISAFVATVGIAIGVLLTAGYVSIRRGVGL